MARNRPRPIIGVCLGFQLICHAFGGQRTSLTVYEAHHWAVQSVSSTLRVLASSSDGIEAVAHTEYKIFGTQFHPESSHSQSLGFLFLEQMLLRAADRRRIIRP